MTDSPRYSIIVPVYNRSDEVADLLRSLASQTEKDFETIIVEDGSPLPCREVVEELGPAANARYIFRPNEGRSYARNAGIEQARGRYLVFFDSDCVIPPTYFATVSRELDAHPLDCYGGPDAACESFTSVQRAISFAMTSMLTTGGIRGRRKSMEKFTPRSFNMGFSSAVAAKVGGFREMFSEDIDISTRIAHEGFSIGLIPEAEVWHKRRVDFAKFFRQVRPYPCSACNCRGDGGADAPPRHLCIALVARAICCLCHCIMGRRMALYPLTAHRMSGHTRLCGADRRLRHRIHTRLHPQHTPWPGP